MKTNVALFVETPSPPVSRANLRLYQLGLNLVNSDYQVHLVVPSFYPHRRRNLVYSGISIQQYPGLAIFLYSGIRFFVRSFHLLFSILYTTLLNKKVRLHVLHGWNPLAGLAAVISSKIIGCPAFIDFTDFYSDIAKTDSPFMTPLFRSVERYILSSAERIMVVSNVMKATLIRYYGISSDKIYVVPDGTNANMFNPNVDGTRIRRLHGLRNKFVLIYHGDIKSPDGVDVLLHALAIVVKKYPNIKLMILGGGGKYFDGLISLVRKLELDSYVIFTGWVPHNEVPKYIAASDVGMMPLRATLNHNCYVSFKLFEYWGIGKPVVVSRVAAISEIVKDGINGVLVNPGNKVDLAGGILSILEDPEKAKAMGAKGRKLVEEKYNWQNLMDNEQQIYNQYNFNRSP